MDIGSKHGYPASALSNFAPHRFVYDDEESASMEGFLQSLKFSNPEVARSVRQLVGLAAKKRGSKRNDAWQRARCLWWKGEPVDRFGQAYQDLLDGAFRAMFDQSDSARKALLASGTATLTHSIGRRKKSETILTTSEFCGRLTVIRNELQRVA